MFAINHAATALVLKKKFPLVSIVPLLISVQLIELLWVLFNYLGIEYTTTESVVMSVNDIHLSFMPYSHSIVFTLGIALSTWVIGKYLFNKSNMALAVAIGIISHILLDLVTHNPDITIIPFMEAPKLGLGIYAIPFAGFIVESIYGVFCWYYYEGGKALLAVILLFNLANVSMFTPMIVGPESIMANAPYLLTTVILLQIVVTLVLVGYFVRKNEKVFA